MFLVQAFDYDMKPAKEISLDNSYKAEKCAVGLWKNNDKYQFVVVSENDAFRWFFGNSRNVEEGRRMVYSLADAIASCLEKK